jgi:hypothetical protein
MFNGGKTELRAIASHNRNEDVGQFQEGGTAMMIYGDLIQQFDSEGSGRDNLGLGRWTYMKLVAMITSLLGSYAGILLVLTRRMIWAQCTSNTTNT